MATDWAPHCILLLTQGKSEVKWGMIVYSHLLESPALEVFRVAHEEDEIVVEGSVKGKVSITGNFIILLKRR